MKTNQKLLLMLVVLFSLTSCKKYEDGPFIDFHSKTERVANSWKISQATDNGNNITSDYNKYDLNLLKNGTASLVANYKFLGVDYELTTDGTWTFLDDNEKLSFDFDNNDADGIYKILRLKEDEMWLKKDAGTLELHFVNQ